MRTVEFKLGQSVKATIYYDEEVDSYIARCPALRISSQGKTENENYSKLTTTRKYKGGLK